MSDLDFEYKFVNADHERTYHEARRMLNDELRRQKEEGDRLIAEWERYSDEERRKNIARLLEHFANCRRPYEKILTDTLALCSIVQFVETQ